jgi:hypothetical protein
MSSPFLLPPAGGPFTTIFDASGYLGLPFSTKLKYEGQWNTYNRIQLANSNVSTLRSGGDLRLTYYQFSNFIEKNDFLNGMFLHQKRYPASNWNPVSKD